MHEQATGKSAAQSHRGRWFASVLVVVAALTLSLGPANTPLAQ